MTEPAKSPCLSNRFRFARYATFAGMAVLICAGAMPWEDRTSPSSPAGLLLSEDGPHRLLTEGMWVLLSPYMLALFLLPLWLLRWTFRREGAHAALGWVACLGCFVLFLGIDLVAWKILSPELSHVIRKSWWRDRENILFMGCLALTSAATLGSLSACAAPARLRVSACVAIAGAWSLCFFVGGLMAMAHFSYGFWISLAASAVMAAGGITETLLLWRHGRVEGGSR